MQKKFISFFWCNKDYLKTIDEELPKWFKNTFKFSNNDINKSIFLLKKGVYPYDHMDDWESLMTQHYLKKKHFMAT